MWPFKKKEKFADGGFVNHEKQPDHQELKPNELDISEPIKTIAELIGNNDKRFSIRLVREGLFYGFVISSDKIEILVNSLETKGDKVSFFGCSNPDIGLTSSEAKMLYLACDNAIKSKTKINQDNTKNRVKLVEIYCNSKESN